MKRQFFWFISGMILSGVAPAQQKSATKAASRSSTVTVESRKVRKPSPPARTKAATKAASSAKAKTTPKPAPATKTKAAARRSATPTPRPGQPAAKGPAARVEIPKPPPNYPADPYHLARFFPRKIDALTFVITPERKRQYELDSARRKVDALSGALNRFSMQLMVRYQAYGASLRALAVLQSVNSDPVRQGTSLSLPHLIAVRSQMRSQAELLEMGLHIHGALREETNRVAEELSRLENADATGGEITPDPFALTQSVLDHARLENDALLRQRSLSTNAERLLSAVRRIAPQEDLQRLSDFAPPSPGGEIRYAPFIPPDTPLPEETIARTRPMPPEPKATPLQLPGIQLPLRAGARILAPDDGTIIFSDKATGQGYVVIIAHDTGLYSVFANLAESLAIDGSSVGRNTPVGIAPQNSAVYFEVRRDGKPVPPGQLLGTRTAESLMEK